MRKGQGFLPLKQQQQQRRQKIQQTSIRNILIIFVFLSISTIQLCSALSNTITTTTTTATTTTTRTLENDEEISITWCDESKCRTIDPNDAPGYWWMPTPPEDFQGGYTCWAPISSSISSTVASEEIIPNFICAEGYTGKPVPNVLQKDENGNTIAQWYTCCADEGTTLTSTTAKNDDGEQQQQQGAKNSVDAIIASGSSSTAAIVATDADYAQEQTCSDAYCDPITTPNCWAAPHGLAPRRCVDNENEGENKFRFPRNTGATVEVDNGAQQYTLHQFLCCKEPPLNPEEESNIIGSDPELDHDGDLIPDGCSLDACTSLNGAKGGPGDCWADGVTEPFTCDTKDPNNPFIYPTRNGFDDRFIFNFHYLCCDSPDYFDNGQEGDDLHIALAVQSTISFVTAIVSFVFFTAILCNKKARSQPWNIYLVMLSIPDTVYNFFRFGYGVAVITRSNTFVTTTWFIDWFYAVANLLLNAIVVYEVHKFLRAFKGMVRIPPPSRKDVLVQSFFVYMIALGCGSWMYTLHTIGNTITGSHPDFLKAHKISLICMVIPPIFVVVAICADVWYRHLLPSANGRTRMLALYFLRVIFVFLVTWLPYMILITFGLRESRILSYIGMCISSVQGTLSVIVALSKPDIEWAVKSFLMGKCNAEPPKEDSKQQRGRTMGRVQVSGLNTGVDSSRVATEIMPMHSRVGMAESIMSSDEFEITSPIPEEEGPDVPKDIEGIDSNIIRRNDHGSKSDSDTSEMEIGDGSIEDRHEENSSRGSHGGSTIDASFRVDMTGTVQVQQSSANGETTSLDDDN